MDPNKYKAATPEQMDCIYEHWDKIIEDLKGHELFKDGEPELSIVITGRVKNYKVR